MWRSGSVTVGSLFAGIGGFDLAAERVWGAGTVRWQIEIDPWCRRVLAKHWPDVRRYGDIREVDGSELEPVDLACGGFPCQPFSCTGPRTGTADERYLWPQMFRIIQEVRPAWVVGENVPHLAHLALGEVVTDLEGAGYEVAVLDIPACAVDAPHIRQRLWILAYAAGLRRGPGSGPAGANERTNAPRSVGPSGAGLPADPDRQGLAVRESVRRDGGAQFETAFGGCRWDPEPDVVRVVHGVSAGLDRPARRRITETRKGRVSALGNAVVPAIPEYLFRLIDAAERGAWQ